MYVPVDVHIEEVLLVSSTHKNFYTTIHLHCENTGNNNIMRSY